MRISDFAVPADAIGQAANVVGDDRVPDGAQWRVSLGRGFLMPGGPVALHRCRIEPSPVTGSSAVTSSRELPAEVAPGRPLALFPLRWSGMVPFWIEVHGGGRLRVAVTAPTMARNRAAVELAAVDEPPYRVGAAPLVTVLVTGEGHVDEVTVWYLPGDAGVETEQLSVDALPDRFLAESGELPPDHPLLRVYAQPQAGHLKWERRVLEGAPSVEVPYALVSPDPAYREERELDRVTTLAGADASVEAWLLHAAEAAARGVDDAIVVDGAGAGSPPVRARHRAAESLGVAALDPGISRWLARSGTIDGGMIGDGPDGLELLVAQVPGLFLGTAGILPDFGGSAGELYDAALADGWNNLIRSIVDLPGNGSRTALQVALLNVPIVFSTESRAARPAAPMPAPADPPDWYADPETGGVGWRQSIALGGVAPVGPVSLEQVAPGDRMTLHPTVDDAVAAPMTAAWPSGGGSATVIASVPVRGGAGDPPDVTWRLRVGDWTGRWSDAAELTGSPPPRPRPPEPVIEAWATALAAIPPGKTSTATVRVDLSFAPSGAPGSLPVDRIEWSVDAVAQPPIVPTAAERFTGLRVSRDLAAPETSPGESATMRFEAVVVAGTTTSEPTRYAIAVTDPRPLPAPRIAPRLMPTSRPTADPEVSITLTVGGVPRDGAVRFLFANETAVRAALGIAGPAFRATPRHERAADLRQAGGGPASAYSAALPEPVRAQDGRATATLRFPAGSNDLILVRALPVAITEDAAHVRKETASTPFAATQPAFVVVPTSDVPGIPIVHATVAANGRVNVEVRLPETSTERFGGGPPEARLVQVVDDAPPAYWPEVATLALDRTEAGEHVGRIALPGPAWTRVGLAAAVRYPAEPLVTPGAVVAPGDLVAAGPGATATTVRAPWGPVSAPGWVDVPGKMPRVEATVEPDGSWRIAVSDLPPARPDHPSFTVELYRGADTLVLESTTPVDADHAEFEAGPFVGDRGAVLLVDPFDRRGALHRVTP
ncbi:hypothetical protein GCM10009819_29500 [Agromyces tropicus]|uniref:Uncharacterized protein n=1 Tax=Agromyces tropicus TaxID=555371 RepID=A0ABP5GC23_9MICO